MFSILASLYLVNVAAGSTSEAKYSGRSLDMSSHSLKAPFSYDTGLGSWIISGASVAHESFMQIVPSIEKRLGFVFHSQPVETDNFIATLDLDFERSADAAISETPVNQAFGFWFVSQNVSDSMSRLTNTVVEADWSGVLKREGFGMNGVVPPNFKGIGVIFTGLTDIVVVTSDGSKPAASFDILNLKVNAINNFDFRRRGVKMTVAINRSRGAVTVYLNDGDKHKGHLEVKTGDIPAVGYLGMTAFSGFIFGAASKPDRVVLRQLRSINLDLAAGLGETSLNTNLSDLEKKLQTMNLHLDDLVMEDRDNETIEDQVKDVHKAVSIISEYLADTRWRDQNLVRSMSEIQVKADLLEDLVNDLRLEIKYAFKSSGGNGGSLTQEIRGLEELIKLHSEENQSIHELKEKVKTRNQAAQHGGGGNEHLYKQLLESNAELEEEMVSANFNANAAIGIFGLVVLLLGCLLYAKMRQYEKRHFL